MPLTINDFPDEIKEIIDPLKPTAAREGACPSEQPVCHPDARVTAQLEEKPLQERLLPWRISNAEKGHLLMTPGGPGGMIGGLLARLEPPQFYSHMGILTEDMVELRHATASMKRLKRFSHREGNIIAKGSSEVVDLIGLNALNEAPTDGFQEDPLRFAWPGTVTQSVEAAWMSWADPWYEDLGYPNKAARDDYIDSFKFKDATSGESFLIDALTFAPAHVLVKGEVAPCQPTPGDGEWMLVWPLVVKPCLSMETQAVRDALNRVAEACKELRGHYRFYAYTLAAVGLDPSKRGPVMTEPLVPDPVCPNLKVLPTSYSVGMVCSTFIWLAVQLVNDRADPSQGRPRIVLDGRPRGWTPKPNACQAFFKINPTLDKATSQTPDGLYEYSKEERARAGSWLYDYIYRCEVVKEIDESTELQDQLDKLFKDSSTVWTTWKIAKLLTLFSPVQVGLILEIASETLEFLVKLLSDMPDDVASQVANSFASDDCTLDAADSDAWKDNPGTGTSVSPDNIIRSWAAPSADTKRVIHGIYGHNVKAKPEPPEYQENGPPPSIWKISQGFGTISHGIVRFKGVAVPFARVRIGCLKLTTDENGMIPVAKVPEGRYWATASWQDPNTELILEPAILVNKKTSFPFIEGTDDPELRVLAKGRAVVIPENGTVTGMIFDLVEPPDNKRLVWFEGHMDNVNRYAIGKDWWDHPKFAKGPLPMGDIYPNKPEYAGLRAGAMKRHFPDVTFQIDDWGQSQLRVVVQIAGEADASVPPGIRHKTLKVTCQARLKEIEDDPWQSEKTFYVLPKNMVHEPGHKEVFDLVRSELAWPVRSHIELTIHNDPR